MLHESRSFMNPWSDRNPMSLAVDLTFRCADIWG
jgi:hypothetical protein